MNSRTWERMGFFTLLLAIVGIASVFFFAAYGGLSQPVVVGCTLSTIHLKDQISVPVYNVVLIVKHRSDKHICSTTDIDEALRVVKAVNESVVNPYPLKVKRNE